MGGGIRRSGEMVPSLRLHRYRGISSSTGVSNVLHRGTRYYNFLPSNHFMLLDNIRSPSPSRLSSFVSNPFFYYLNTNIYPTPTAINTMVIVPSSPFHSFPSTHNPINQAKRTPFFTFYTSQEQHRPLPTQHSKILHTSSTTRHIPIISPYLLAFRSYRETVIPPNPAANSRMSFCAPV